MKRPPPYVTAPRPVVGAYHEPPRDLLCETCRRDASYLTLTRPAIRWECPACAAARAIPPAGHFHG